MVTKVNIAARRARGNVPRRSLPPAPATSDGRTWNAGLLSLGVFCVAAAFFLLLMSGHIYAHDEETLYLMTDGIAVRGLPLVSPDAWGIVRSSAPSKYGLLPTSYAPGQPLLAVPLYWLGRAVADAGGHASAVYLNRFVVLAFNAFVTAATAALLFRFALALGYRRRAGAALALCYGAATYAAIQARTFFAEPLTALLVLLAFFLMYRACTGAMTERRQAVLLAGSGFAGAYALIVKVHAALFLPVLALYLALITFPSVHRLKERRAWRAMIRRGAWWGAGIALPVLALLLYDRWLYGNPLTTGYGDGANLFTTPLATGLYGLLISSGKGVIWYAPPLLFALVGIWPFLRRFPGEGVAVVLATVINLLFYARLQFWHGDGAWGPRYLLIVLPWMLLPALPVLDRLLKPGGGGLKSLARVGAVVVVLAGVFVQSLAVAVSFDVPILTSTSEQARYFTPSQSPLVLSFRTARARIGTWWGDAHPPVNTMLLRGGFYPPENAGSALFPRWTNGDAVVALHPRNGAALHIKLTYFDHRPPAMRATPTPVTLSLGATALTPADRLAIAPDNEGFILAYDVPPDLLRSAGGRLTIVTPTWNPFAAHVNDRNEDLGIFINNLEVWADGVPLTIRTAEPIDGVPSTPRHVWLWANYPEYPHRLDWWPVLLHDARLPGPLAASLVAGMCGCVALLLLAGGGCVRLARGKRASASRALPLAPAADGG